MEIKALPNKFFPNLKTFDPREYPDTSTCKKATGGVSLLTATEILTETNFVIFYDLRPFTFNLLLSNKQNQTDIKNLYYVLS